jgi:uncharacterized phosphosugar-binding protein
MRPIEEQFFFDSHWKKFLIKIMFEYQNKILQHLDQLTQGQEEQIMQASRWFAQTLIDDRLVHTFGTGHSHMIGLELFVRAGGLANVNAMLDSTVMTSEGARRSAEIERIPGIAKIIWDQHKIHPEDLFIIISNSGRNAMPLEMAMQARKRKQSDRHHITGTIGKLSVPPSERKEINGCGRYRVRQPCAFR